MDKLKIINYVSIAVIIVSLFFIGTGITGYAVSENVTGVVNVTITSAAALNFTTALLDFGAGAVVGGQTNATLISNGTNTSWTGPGTTGELVLENIGNVNVSLTLSTDINVTEHIGGESPSFKAKVTNSSGEEGACTTGNFTDYAEINQTLQIACANFAYDDAFDSIDIDFEVVIPSDASGAKTMGVVAIGTY